MIKKVKNIVFVGLLSCFVAEGMVRTSSLPPSFYTSNFVSEKEDCAESESLASFIHSSADVCPVSDSDGEEYEEEVVQIIVSPQLQRLHALFTPGEKKQLNSIADYCATFKGSEYMAADIILLYIREKGPIPVGFIPKVQYAANLMRNQGLW